MIYWPRRLQLLITCIRAQPGNSVCATTLRTIKRELDRFIALVASGQAPDRVLAEIASREQKIKDLEAELDWVRTATLCKFDVTRVREIAVERANDLRSSLYGDVPGARQVIRELLAGPVIFKLDDPDYRLEAETRIGALFAPEPSSTRIRLASPRRFELRLPP